MKAFTDLEQSKKLTKILPIESADFFWIIGYLHTDGLRYEVIRPKDEVREPEKYWPCWSLAALLDVLSTNLRLGFVINDFQGDREKKYAISSVEHDKYNCYADNPVDACYELILKLHEQKIL